MKQSIKNVVETNTDTKTEGDLVLEKVSVTQIILQTRHGKLQDFVLHGQGSTRDRRKLDMQS